MLPSIWFFAKSLPYFSTLSVTFLPEATQWLPLLAFNYAIDSERSLHGLHTFPPFYLFLCDLSDFDFFILPLFYFGRGGIFQKIPHFKCNSNSVNFPSLSVVFLPEAIQWLPFSAFNYAIDSERSLHGFSHISTILSFFVRPL